MKTKDLRKPTNIFALADHDLFASFTRIGRLAVSNNRLRLYLKKKPATIPGPLWFQELGCHINDPGEQFRTSTNVEEVKEENGEIFLVTAAFRDIPLAETTAKRLSKETTLVIESPFGRKYTLDFHALLRAKKKTSSTP